MASKSFTLNDAGDKLTLTWGLYYSNMKVFLNGNEIGQIPKRSDLKKGRDIVLPSGEILNIKLYASWYRRRSELHILLDGKPVKGSMADPHMQVRRIFIFMLVIGAISVISGLSSLGISSFFSGIDLDQNIASKMEGMHNLAIVSLCIGGGFVFLAFMVRNLSVNAIYAGMILLVISISLRMYISYQMGQGLASGGMLFRLLYLAILYRGAEAIKKIKAEEEGGLTGVSV